MYKPTGKALEKIVNYRNAEQTMFGGGALNVPIGVVRYASTNPSIGETEPVPVGITPEDLMAQKTALFGMTRSGKSNTTKIIVKSVFDLRYLPKSPQHIGQLIFDANGEYANENVQDASGGRVKAAIKNLRDAHPKSIAGDVVTYGITKHPADKERKLMPVSYTHLTLPTKRIV